MKFLIKSLVLASFLYGLVIASVSAQMSSNTGIVPHDSLPSATNTKAVVLLDIPHIRQKPWMCVPTSTAMILGYFGENHKPSQLKTLAESHKAKAKQNTQFTYYKDMLYGLRGIGKHWLFKSYPKTKNGFTQGLRGIKSSLRKGNPVMVDVHLGYGHTFVVMGYNENEHLIYIRDPDIVGTNVRALTYKQFREHWHNHRYGKSRSVIFSRP